MKRTIPLISGIIFLVHSNLSFAAPTIDTWLGTTSGSMNDAGNWSGGVPDATGMSALNFVPEDGAMMPPPNLVVVNDIPSVPFILCAPDSMVLYSITLTTPVTTGYQLSGNGFQVQNGQEAIIQLGGPGSTLPIPIASSISNDLDINGGALRLKGSNAFDQVTGNISGTGNLYFDAGGLLLGGTTKTYTATAHIAAATLRLGGNDLLPVTTATTSIGLGGILDLNGYSQRFDVANLQFVDPSAVVQIGTGTLKIINSSTNSLTGSLLSSAGGGTFELDPSSSGMLTVSGNNTYSNSTSPGNTRVAGGAGTTLTAGGVNAFGTHSNLTVAPDTTLDCDTFNLTFNTIQGAGTIKVASGNTLTVIDSSTFPGIIDGGAATNLSKSGPGALVLTNPANSYGGITSVSGGGTLQIAHPSGLGSQLNILDGTIDLNGNAVSINQLIGGPQGELKLGGGSLTLTAGTEIRPFYGTISGPGTIVLTNGTTPTFLGSNTFTGTTQITNTATLNTFNLGMSSAYNFDMGGGTLTIGSDSSSAALFQLNAPATIATNSWDLELTGQLIGSSHPFTKLGTGTLFLNPSAPNSFSTTPLHLQGGILKVSQNGLGTPQSITFENFCGVIQATENLTIVSPIIVASTATFDTNGFNISVSAPINCANPALGLPCGGLAKTGGGTLTLTGPNAYAGTTVIREGTLTAGSSSLPSTTTLVFADSGTGVFQASSEFSSFPVTIFNKSGTIDTNGHSLDLTQIIAGTKNASFTKSGAGTLTLSGANLYTGPTVVHQGTLKTGISSTPSSGALGVGSEVTVHSGATLDFDSYSTSVETLTNQGTLEFQVLNSSNFGRVTANKTAIINGTLVVNALPNFTMEQDEVINLITGESVTANFSPLFQNFPPSFTPSLITLPGAIQLTINGGGGGFIPVHNFAPAALLAFIIADEEHQLILRKCESMRERFAFQFSYSEPEFASLESPLVETNPVIEQRERLMKEKTQEKRKNKPLSLYVGPIASFGTIKSKHQQVGFGYHSLGGVAGFDYVIPDQDYLRSYFGWGSIVEYRKEKGSAKDQWGSFSVEKIKGSLYATLASKELPALSFNASGGFSYAWDTLHRSTATNTAIGKTVEKLFDVLFDIEFTLSHETYSWMSNNFSLIPLVNIQYIHNHIDSYQEQGAGRSNLSVESQSPQSLSSSLGIRLCSFSYRENHQVRLEVDGQWQREYLYLNDQYISYSSLNSARKANVYGIGKNSWLLGVDLFATFYNAFQLEVSSDFKWNNRFFDAFFYLGIGAQY